MIRTTRPEGRRRGSALLICAITLSGLAVMSLSMLQLTTSTSDESAFSQQDAQAHYLAESAFHEGVTSLLYGADGNLGTETTPLSFGGGVVWVESEQVGVDLYQVRATGASAAARTTLEGVVRRAASGNLGVAIFSDKRLDLKKGVFTDSYDSDLGDYASQAVNTTDGVTHARSLGHVASNDDIRVDKQVKIFGDLLYGPDGEFKLKKGGEDSVYGEPTPLDVSRDYAAVTPPEGLPPALPKVHLHGDPLSEEPDLVLGPGKIHYESMKIHKDAKVRIVGPATVVVDKKLDLDSNLVVDGSNGPVALFVGEKLHFKKKNRVEVVSGKPEDFLVLVGTKTDKKGKIKKTKVKLEGEFTGVLYAPHAHVDFKKESEVFGAIVAHSVKVHKDTRIHFDEALSRMNSEHIGDPTMELICLYETGLDSEHGLNAKRKDPLAELGLKYADLTSLADSWQPSEDAFNEEVDAWDEDSFPWVEDDWWPDVDYEEEEADSELTEDGEGL